MWHLGGWGKSQDTYEAGQRTLRLAFSPIAHIWTTGWTRGAPSVSSDTPHLGGLWWTPMGNTLAVYLFSDFFALDVQPPSLSLHSYVRKAMWYVVCCSYSIWGQKNKTKFISFILRHLSLTIDKSEKKNLCQHQLLPFLRAKKKAVKMLAQMGFQETKTTQSCHAAVHTIRMEFTILHTMSNKFAQKFLRWCEILMIQIVFKRQSANEKSTILVFHERKWEQFGCKWK